MTNREVEMKLLDDYLEAAVRAEKPEDANRSLARYEKQLALCKSQGFDFNVGWCEAMVYYIKANHKLNAEGFVEGVLRGTARQSTGFEGIIPALAAREREMGRGREAIALLDQAISIYPDDADFWFLRAHLNHAIKDKKAGLRDINHVLSEFGGDEKLYIEARKLKDEIDAIKDDDGKCFIATAVYENPNSFELGVLRNFRDQVLLSSSAGRLAVSCYYATSPNMARLLRRSRRAKLAVRVILLDPLVALLNHWNNQG